MSKETIKIGPREFLRDGKTYVCGILNVTPDSFSDGGKWTRLDAALWHVEEMQKAGADMVDVGGESSRPGGQEISEDEEMSRVLPVIEAVKSRFNIPVSLDTWKSKVAREGILAGADLINDIWGLKKDLGMAEVIAESGLPCCLMHNRLEPVYGDFMRDVVADLSESLQIATGAGIVADKIILDPGIGFAFAKNGEQNLQLLRELERLKKLGFPLLLGCSRKSFIGEVLGLPVEERLEGTLATTVLAVVKGCSFVRVHDVSENMRAVRMAEAIIYG